MAISKSQHRVSLGSCNVVPGRGNINSSRNRNNNIVSSSLYFVLLAVISMQLATGLAEPFESTTQMAELASTDTEVVRQDMSNFQFGSAADELEDDNFGSLSEGGLEQDIRDAVKSEVESEIEAGAFDFVLARHNDHAATPEQPVVSNREDKDDGENSREAKTLDGHGAADEESTPTPEPEAEPDSESELETATESETAESRHRPLPNVTSDLVSVIFNEDRAITEQPITKTNLLALEQEHKDFEMRYIETTPAPVYEPPKHQVTKKQGVEDLLPIEVPVVPEIEGDINRKNRKIEPDTKESLEPVTVAHLPDIEENIIEDDTNPQPEIEVFSSPKPSVNVETDDAETELKMKVETETGAETEASSDVEVQEGAADDTEDTTNAFDIQKETTTEVNIAAAESSTDIAYEEETTITTVVEEETGIKDKTNERADDSTATPLVSYPPHDADQTFDSNLADERTAHLSLASSSRSTLIIALCSGTAVIFIIISLVIFVVSFQRQHGTLDIEMQEQRLGKDSLDEEDAQLKLLDVDLSAPAILVSMGNEETDECL